MTEVKTRPVPANRVDDITKARDIPGAFKFFTSDGTGPTGIDSCGCRALAPLHFKPSRVRHGPGTATSRNRRCTPACTMSATGTGGCACGESC
jgi:hypothetical protein